MKKFINLLLLSIVAFTFFGCNQSTGPSEEELQKQREEQEKLELEQRILNRKKEIWNSIEGVWEIDPSSVGEWEKGTEYENVIIATDSFTIDGVQKSINLDTDAVLATELPEDDVYGYAEWQEHEDCFDLVINFKNVRLSIGTYRNDPVLKIIRRNGNPDDDALFEYVRAGSQDKDDESDEGNGNNEETLDFSIEGDWNYTISAGNTQTTLSIENDGVFSFKKNNDTINGTYSLSGNKITFNFERSMVEIEDTFTISGSENEITLVLIESKTITNGQPIVSTEMSGMLNTFYNIATSKSVILSK